MATVEKIFTQIAGKDGHASVADFVRYFKKHSSNGVYLNTGSDLSDSGGELQKAGKGLGMNLAWLIGGEKLVRSGGGGWSSGGTRVDGYEGCDLRQIAIELVGRGATGNGKKSGAKKSRAARLAAIKGQGLDLAQFKALRNRI